MPLLAAEKGFSRQRLRHLSEQAEELAKELQTLEKDTQKEIARAAFPPAPLDKRLPQPVYLGLRDDKIATEVVQQEA